jgi:hypothetical protein
MPAAETKMNLTVSKFSKSIAAGLVLGAAFVSAPAFAENAMKECSADYQAAKSANQLGSKTWTQFLAECRVKKAQGASAAPAAGTPAAAPAATAPAAPTKAAPAAAAASNAIFPKAVDPKYASEKAGVARRKTCTDQYNANKATNANGGLEWIQKGGGYYSECNKRLKG